jgi:hypothetical protein
MRATMALPALMILAACGGTEEVEKVVIVDDGSCLACHRPVQAADGVRAGLEEAHPAVDGERLSCTDCHGGDDRAFAQSEAHVQPLPGASPYIKSLTTGELDEVRPEYMQFVNPGDLRAAPKACGAGSPRAAGSGCHQETVEIIERNQMATFSGELGVARYRAGVQATGAGVKGIRDVRDEDYDPSEPATVGSLQAMEEPRLAPGEDEIGPFQDLYLTKACMRCHLWSFGDNKFPGDFRSSGCTACHMVYADDGVSQSADPALRAGSPPHPIKHELTKAIPSQQCMHCHYRGGRIGPSYMGYRESGGGGFNPPNFDSLGQALHGHDADFYIVDEEVDNDFDETPPDVHFEAGMHCIDCHTVRDVHGDGRLYADTENAVEIECEDCHGTADRETTMITRRGTRLTHLSKDEDGIWLTGKVSGERLKVTQISESLAGADHGSQLFKEMGRDEDGFSHLDRMECYACHSAWIPTCFGCHVEVDLSKTQRSLVGGRTTPGSVVGSRRWVETDVMIFMLNTEGRIAPSMPAERMFFTAINGAGETVIDSQVRRGPNGQPGMGHRAFPPHTVRRTTNFMACRTCHPIRGTAENMDDLAQLIGLGSDQFLQEDGDGVLWPQDRLLTEDFEPTVLVGHDEPLESRPLTTEIIENMLGVEVD